MKSTVLPLAIAITAGFFLASPALHAEISTISVRVEAVNKSEVGKPDHHVVTQSHALKIFISNTSKEVVDVKAKYFFFGRDMKEHTVDKINEGEKEAQVKPSATEMVEAPAATTTYTDEHYAAAAGGGGGKGAAKPGKKVEASGSRFVGYAVQVYQGEKLVAEAYDPASMKDEISKAGAAPKGGDIKAGAPAKAKK